MIGHTQLFLWSRYSDIISLLTITVRGVSIKHCLLPFFIIFLFFVTAAGVVPCGIPKKRPRTSSIVQFIFFFWFFEISRYIRNQK